jgi:hypothetical protein
MRSERASAYSAYVSVGWEGQRTFPRLVERVVPHRDDERDMRQLGARAGFEEFNGAVDGLETTDLLRFQSALTIVSCKASRAHPADMEILDKPRPDVGRHQQTNECVDVD